MVRVGVVWVLLGSSAATRETQLHILWLSDFCFSEKKTSLWSIEAEESRTLTWLRPHSLRRHSLTLRTPAAWTASMRDWSRPTMTLTSYCGIRTSKGSALNQPEFPKVSKRSAVGSQPCWFQQQRISSMRRMGPHM